MIDIAELATPALIKYVSRATPMTFDCVLNEFRA
jgi:hypothetical protein